MVRCRPPPEQPFLFDAKPVVEPGFQEGRPLTLEDAVRADEFLREHTVNPDPDGKILFPIATQRPRDDVSTWRPSTLVAECPKCGCRYLRKFAECVKCGAATDPA